MKARSSGAVIAGLLALAPGAPARAGEAQVSIQASAGAILATNLPELSYELAGLFAFGATWPASDSVRLGIRQQLAITSIPYGSSDGEPVIGARGGQNPEFLSQDVTFLPSTTFWVKFQAHPRFSIDAMVGIGLLASSKLGLHSFLPSPVGGLGADLLLSQNKTSSWHLRAQCDVTVVFVYKSAPAFFLPQIGFVYAF